MCLRVDNQNASYPPFTLYLCETYETFDKVFRFAPLNETLSINPITVDCFNQFLVRNMLMVVGNFWSFYVSQNRQRSTSDTSSDLDFLRRDSISVKFLSLQFQGSYFRWIFKKTDVKLWRTDSSFKWPKTKVCRGYEV